MTLVLASHYGGAVTPFYGEYVLTDLDDITPYQTAGSWICCVRRFRGSKKPGNDRQRMVELTSQDSGV